ncbi:MAG: NTP transferase domain-containing protein [Alphaproteobacteria bacterium]|nr:NTP transferase domain-containing protein [Alphaproteobacteria bacterium]
MEFGAIPVAEAAGAILAHAERLGERTLKKGHRLTEEDCAAFRAAGRDTVIAARLAPGDVHEDEAADRLAAALAGAHLRRAAPFTGRVNLYATAPGVLTIDQARIAAMNAIDESLTVATGTPFDAVAAGEMVATIKIIPFAAPEEALAAAERAAGSGAIAVAPFGSKKIALISTALPATKPSILEKNRAVLAARLEALGNAIASERRCAHDEAAIAGALKDAAGEAPDLILLFGASATIDRRDVVPAGLVAAGGTIERYGMPVDPGNLLLLGRLGEARVIGLPGCARSPKRNGFDWVLERLIADLPLDGAAIAAMGVGGLLKEIHTRPQPREVPAAAPRAPKIAALVLAAGFSRRMGANKLLLDLGGTPVIRRTLDQIRTSAARPIIVVTGEADAAIRDAAGSEAVTFVPSPDAASGLSASLRAGLGALPDECDGVLVCLGDMPEVTARDIDRLIAAFAPIEGRAICVPTRGGKRGNPILWARSFVPEMMRLTGDKGAKELLGEAADSLCEVEIDNPGILYDLDTPEALEAARARLSGA